MEKEIISYLSKKIIRKFQNKFGNRINIEEELNILLKSSLNEDCKKKTLELLYLFQFYNDAYIGPDPRGKSTLLGYVSSVLRSQTEDEFNTKIENLEHAVEMCKLAETHPISTTKRMLEDAEKYKNSHF